MAPVSWHKVGARGIRYGLVGAMGYAVNIAVFALAEGQLPRLVAASAAFCVAWAHNLLWHRHWTFPGASSAALPAQGGRYLLTSLADLALALALLEAGVAAGLAPLTAQAVAVGVAAPVGFALALGWSFRAGAEKRPRR